MDCVLNLGAKVILYGDTFEEAEKYAFTQFDIDNYIAPFDSNLTIDGQSKIVDELISQQKEPFDYIFCPVGGGGLMSGILRGMQRHSLNTKVIGVEQYLNNSMQYSIKKGYPIRLPNLDMFCDGTAVSKPGIITFKECKNNKFYSVSKTEIIKELCAFYENNEEYIEPSAALSIAGMRKHFKLNSKKYREKKDSKGKSVCLLITGNHVSNEVKQIIENKISKKKRH